MPLRFVAPPPEVMAEYRESMLDFLGPHEPEVTLYHVPVGTLGLLELSEGATFADIQASGCRILAAWPTGTWTSCEMTDPTLYAKAKFRNFAQGDSVELAFKRIAEAQEIPLVQLGEYELHFLGIPGIQVEALHLKSKGLTCDFVLPILSEDLDWIAEAILQTETFFARIVEEDLQLATRAVVEGEAFLAWARNIASARLALPTSSVLSS